MLLAGDIGGTKTDLAVYSPIDGLRAPLTEKSFPSADYRGLAALVREFVASLDWSIERAVFGVAGPVIDGRSDATNLPWSMDERELRSDLGLSSVHLMNDLEAIAQSLPFLRPEDLRELSRGQPEPGGVRGVIAPGTGLGEAFLTESGGRFVPHPSEGGHASFSPCTDLQFDLLAALRKERDHVSVERVCSGLGIPFLYAFLRDSGRAEEPPSLAAELREVADPTRVIVAKSVGEGAVPICVATLELFLSILGVEAGNLALKVLATGGLYIGGGLPPRLLPLFESGPFMASFLKKGRFSGLLSRIPVYVILNPKAALLGAAARGLEL